ncbi:hypothetical protein GPECTOR_12g396 [Gonium pectorale]|uniref:Uncharacterized protein n=1 Tax=Gonium pectorale TaxID=33097 RepID=A0A150GNQ3_GONPE|nr:hypothetical protein GPECTOR_12g396 [Gonium pectorale]|eukprot:KXZ51434.1 hypothetical protein GPECTOR_12g396 [Gonium pectorale]
MDAVVASSPFGNASGASNPPAGSLTSNGSASVALGIGDTDSAADEGGAAPAARPYRHSHSDTGPRSAVMMTEAGQALSGGGAAMGASTTAVAGGGGAAAAAGLPRSSDASNDPAVAWYSRALHRQVSTAAIATQVSGGAPKAHLA